MGTPRSYFNKTVVFFFFLVSSLNGAVFIESSNLYSNEVVVKLPSGREYLSQKKGGQDLTEGDFSWYGEVQGEKKGFLSYAKVSETFHGSLSFAGGGFFEISGASANLLIELKKPEQRMGCGVCKEVKSSSHLPPDPRMRAQPVKSWRNGDANLIDLLIVYPTAVKSEAGGATEVEARIAGAVSDANLCYLNSRVSMQLRVVHTAEINYTPSGNLDLELSRLQTKNDGYFDEIHNLRDQYGADLVCMLTTTSNAGGLASTMTHPKMSFESSGFNVNVWDQLGAPSYTLAHEIGHNMGCLHNREDSDWDSTYEFSAFSFGKRWIENGEGYGTIMAYDTSPVSTFPNTVPFFSNPNVTYLTTATGNTGSEDNAQVLRLTVPYVSNFRNAVMQGIVPSVFSLNLEEEATGSFNIRLSAKPSGLADVNVSISGDTNLILSGPTSIGFDSNNWNIPQTIMVTAQADTNTLNGSGTISLSSAGISTSQVVVSENDTGSLSSSNHQFSGVVRNELGLGVAGVTFSFSSSGETLESDLNGTFSTYLSDGWSGTVTPLKDGYIFDPVSFQISTLNSDSVGHIFKAVRSNILFVDKDATGNGDGTTWAHAYPSLTEALLSQNSFTEVWVADGTYLPGDIRPSTFLLPPGIGVYGGFNGTESSRSQSDPALNITVLSGDIGVPNDISDNAYHVIIPSDGSLLSGFTIRGGNANKNYSNDDRGKGGGLWGDSSDFTISNCTFTSNFAYQGGAGIYLKDVNASIINCVFLDNQSDSTGKGGAAYLEDSNVSLQACSFSSNTSGLEAGAILWTNSVGSIVDSNFTGNQNTQSNGGGAMFIDNSSPLITGCNFSQNITFANNFGGAIKLVNSSPVISDTKFIRNRSSTNSAGAIYIDSSSVPSFSGNEFRFNSSAQFGGAVFAEGPNLEMNNTLFIGNYSNLGGGVATQGTVGVSFLNTRAYGNEANSSSSSDGGFIYLNTGSTGSLFINCVFSGNKSLGRSGVYRSSGTSRFVNCTFSGNQAGTLGGIVILFSGSTAQMDNCILWGNSADNGNDILVNTGAVTANNSLFNPSQSSGSISGSDNFNANPLFTDADGTDNIFGTEDDDMSLQSASPAVDIGSTAVSDYSITDLLGVSRGGSPDAGAYEYYSNSSPVFATPSTFSVFENQTLVADINATDQDADSLLFAISSGADRDKFSINSATGQLSFISAPDFENPQDQGNDNVFNIELSVSDGLVLSYQSMVITVLDVSEDEPVEFYVLTISLTQGGSATGGGSYENGHNATLLANANTGYSFLSWSGDRNSTENPFITTVDSNLSIIAKFSLDPIIPDPFEFNATVLECVRRCIGWNRSRLRLSNEWRPESKRGL